MNGGNLTYEGQPLTPELLEAVKYLRKSQKISKIFRDEKIRK
jgi:hypothetical protein